VIWVAANQDQARIPCEFLFNFAMPYDDCRQVLTIGVTEFPTEVSSSIEEYGDEV